MAHFAEIDHNNIVVRVLVVDNAQEHRGQEFLADDLELGGTWVQTSYNNNIRKQFAGIGFTYDNANDVFIAPKPAEWFVLNETFDWVCPEGINPTTGDPYTEEQLEVLAMDSSLDGAVLPGGIDE